MTAVTPVLPIGGHNTLCSPIGSVSTIGGHNVINIKGYN